MESERIKSVSLPAHWSLSIMMVFIEGISFSFQSLPFHYLLFFFFFWEPWERLWQLILFRNRESKSAMILLPRCFHNFDSYGHKQKRLDIPKINLNSRRQYTNFTYKPHIIKAILLTTKYTKEENVTKN